MVITDHQPLTHLMEQQALSWLQSRWLWLGLFQPILPKMLHQPGKANIVTDALLHSRPSVGKAEESVQQEDSRTTKMQEEQCDQAFTMTSSVRIEESELMAFKNAEQADPVLKKLRQVARRWS